LFSSLIVYGLVFVNLRFRFLTAKEDEKYKFLKSNPIKLNISIEIA